MKSLILAFTYFTLFFHPLLAQFNYLPAEIPGHQIVAYTQFTLSYNETHEQASAEHDNSHRRQRKPLHTQSRD